MIGPNESNGGGERELRIGVMSVEAPAGTPPKEGWKYWGKLSPTSRVREVFVGGFVPLVAPLPKALNPPGLKFDLYFLGDFSRVPAEDLVRMVAQDMRLTGRTEAESRAAMAGCHSFPINATHFTTVVPEWMLRKEQSHE